MCRHPARMVLLLHFLPLLAFGDSSAIGLDVVLFDHRAPELHLVRQELALYVRAANLQRDLHSLDAALDLGFAQCLRQRIAETIDVVGWLGRAATLTYAGRSAGRWRRTHSRSR